MNLRMLALEASSGLDELDLLEFCHDLFHLLRAQFWIDWKREKLASQLFGDREVALAIAKIGVSLLHVDRNGIVNSYADSGSLERAQHFVAARKAERIDMVDVPAMGGRMWPYNGMPRQQAIILCGH